MQNTFSIECNWSKSILAGEGWESAEKLFEKLNAVPETSFSEHGMLPKAVFISGLRKLILSLELDGDSLKEAKQMTSPGSLFQSLNSDYLFMRGRYLQKRKKLKDQLQIINRIVAFTILYKTRKAAANIVAVIDPSLTRLNEFQNMVVQST